MEQKKYKRNEQKLYKMALWNYVKKEGNPRLKKKYW